jgi:hypothetical protein
MGKKDRKAILIFSLIWVVVCALFSLCGSEFYLPCLICAAFVVGFAWLSVPINSLEVAAGRREAERKERAKNKPPRAPIWPTIRKILGFAAIAIVILVVVGCIKAGASYFIDEYGMIAFLLLLILLVLVF